MDRLSYVAVASLSILALCGASRAAVVYGPAGNPPALMTASPWNWTYGETGGSLTPTAGTQGTVLDTQVGTGAVTKSGFNLFSFNPIAVPLNRAAGYDVKFRVAVTAEAHNDRNVIGDATDDDRAGFSVIVQSSDFLGIELGFFTDRIFSQNANFVGRGEQVAVNTTGMTDYDLVIAGSGYTLSSNGTTLLTGSLRNYTGFGTPYSTFPNWIFMGDDTTSAAAAFEIARVEVTAVPEAGSLGMLGLGMVGLMKRKRHG